MTCNPWWQTRCQLRRDGTLNIAYRYAVALRAERAALDVTFKSRII
jgi:hypothetical protein